MRRGLQIVVIIAAVGAAVMPLPRRAVERWYSRRVYSAIQPRLTTLSNHLTVALFDVTLVAVTVTVLAMWVVGVRRMRRGDVLPSAGTLMLNPASIGALIYLWFLGAWGLNYRREPLHAQLDFQEDRITLDALRALARRARTLVPGELT